MALLLLLTFHGATDVATVTFTKAGTSAVYPWPASGRVTISAPCSTGLPAGFLYLYRDGTWGGYIYWNPDQNELRIYCGQAAPLNVDHSFTHDCSGGDNITYTYTVQLTTDEIRVMHEGLSVAARHRDGGCGSDPDMWWLQSVAGPLTASDEGLQFEQVLQFFRQSISKL